MKKYVKPLMEGQVFVTNEYIGACTIIEDSSKYYFRCDAGNGKYGGLYSTTWDLVSNRKDSFHACGETHVSPTDGSYFKGFYDPDSRHSNNNELEVYIWEEKNRQGQVIDRHATTNLNKETWNKNHS